MRIFKRVVSQRIVFPLGLLFLSVGTLVLDTNLEVGTEYEDDQLSVGVVVKFPYPSPSDILVTGQVGDFTFSWMTVWSGFLWTSVLLMFLDFVLVMFIAVRYTTPMGAYILLVYSILELAVVLCIKLVFVKYLTSYFDPLLNSGDLRQNI